MFDDRSKQNNGYENFARTTIEVLEKTEIKPQTHENKISDVKKNLSLNSNSQNEPNLFADISRKKLEEIPSSVYLKKFENQKIEDIEQIKTEMTEKKDSEFEVDFINLLNSAENIEVDTKAISKELSKETPKPKKNFSFRIKLVTGVYCILVALFGGWGIGNTINISQTNSYLYETTAKTTEINNNIVDIIGDLTKLDSVSGDPEDDTIVVKIVAEEIDIKPEAINKPNDYQKSSNWFDVICNWIASLFGG